MSFAIFYNSADLAPVENALLRADLSADDKTLAEAFWNGGLKGWRLAPVRASESSLKGDPRYNVENDLREVVIDAPGLHLSDLSALLRRIASQIRATILRKMGEDLLRASGGVEPWP